MEYNKEKNWYKTYHNEKISFEKPDLFMYIARNNI